MPKHITETVPFVIHNEDGSQLMAVDITNKWVNFGPNQPAFNNDPNIGVYFVRNQDSYSGINVANYSTGTTASTDVVVFCSNQTGLYDGFCDFGINGGSNADPLFAVFDAGCGYLWTSNSHLYIGTQDVNSDGSGNIYFFTGGTGSKDNIRMTITYDNKMGFFKHAPVAQPTGVEVSAAGIHAALVSLGLITA